MTPNQQGFIVGYQDFVPNKQPLPPAPDVPERYQWIDGWFAGRRLAKQHNKEMEAAIAAVEGLQHV